MSRGFTQKTKLGLCLPHGVEVVVHQLGEPGVLESLGKGDLLLVKFAHFLPLLVLVPLLVLPLIHLLHHLNL